MEKNNCGKFIISLDFELFWGVRDNVKLTDYKERLDGSREVILKILKIFKEFEISSTWAVVGFLFFKNKAELLASIPQKKPVYANKNYSPYLDFDSIGNCETEDPYHFAPSLIRKIIDTDGQEIASHTFSHFYTMEEGISLDDFREDLKVNRKVSEKMGIKMLSLVLPRNQIKMAYLKIAEDLDFKIYRGNQKGFIYKAQQKEKQNLFIRALRLLDAYFKVSPSTIYNVKQNSIINLPASRFFRQYVPRLNFLEPLKLKRIKNEMLRAAKQNKIYHLWWHPHNFGLNQEENLKNLREVLDYYKELNKNFGFESKNMGDFALD
jgi:hypothetical protein